MRKNVHGRFPAAQVTLVPYLMDNQGIGYVQARWAFANPDESYLTKARPVPLMSLGTSAVIACSLKACRSRS